MRDWHQWETSTRKGYVVNMYRSDDTAREMTLYRWFLRFSANYSSRTSTPTSYHSLNHLFIQEKLGLKIIQ